MPGMVRRISPKAWPWIIAGIIALVILLAPMPVSSAPTVEREITIHASSFAYSPGTVHVDPGDRVTLELVATDVAHGLYIDSYDLDMKSEPGKTARLSFIADRGGTYRMRCSLSCGALHPFMIGKLKVGSNSLLWKAIALGSLAVIAAIWSYRR